MKCHTITDCYPLMTAEEIATLADDIKAHGQLLPATVSNGTLLDGRNRLRACQKIGIELKTVEFTGDDPGGFIIATNQRRNMTQSQRAMVAAKMANLPKHRHKSDRPSGLSLSQPEAAKANAVSAKSVKRAKAVLDADPELADKVLQGRVTVAKAEKQVREKQRESARRVAVKKISAAAKRNIADVCDIRHCGMSELLSSGIKPDCIITDPPYPREFVSLYGEMAKLASAVPVVAVMCGQSYLPELMALMSEHLKYRWTLAYLTPGGQAVQQWQAKVNTFWKPVLLFGDSAEWIGDVTKSDVNNNDKRFHEWGQSESGMADLIERLSKPGQLVCDPFVGGGTTAMVALKLGRRFVGCDIDGELTRQAMERCCG